MLTGYKVGTMTNKVLKEKGLKEIPTQMIYRYMDQKMIPFQEVDGQRVISDEDAATWISKYVAKRLDKAGVIATAEAIAVETEEANEGLDVDSPLLEAELV